MMYNEWRDETLNFIYHELLDKGFTPEGAETFVKQNSVLMDTAYAMGRKEEQDGSD